MATVIRKKKDKKKVDEFISTSERIFLSVSENWQKFSLFMAVLVVAFLVFSYAGSSKLKNQEIIFKEIADIERTITASNRDSSIKKLEGIVKQFEGAEGVAYAKHSLARQYLVAGDSEKGEKVLKEILNQHPSRLFSQVSLLDLGLAFESDGKCDSAVVQFRTIIGSQVLFTQPEAYLGLGRCQEQLGNKSEALQAYKGFIQKFPGHPIIDFAKIQVLELES